MKMSLAKALKHKNRLVGRISQISDQITTNNSILAENEKEFDVSEGLKVREGLVRHLVELKTAIHKASDPVRHKIFRKSELVATIQFYKGINTKHGKVSGGFYAAENTTEFKAILRQEDVNRMVLELENEIDGIQDELDEFNSITKIEIEIPESFSKPRS